MEVIKENKTKARCPPVKVGIEENHFKGDGEYFKEQANPKKTNDSEIVTTSATKKEKNELKETKKNKYTKKSYGKKTKKIAEEEKHKKHFVNDYNEEFPALSGKETSVEQLEKELAYKSTSWSKNKMEKVVSAVSLEEGKTFSYVGKDFSCEEFMKFYCGMIGGTKHTSYKPGSSGFVLFRGSTIRFVLTQIATFNPGDENEAREFLESVVRLSDEDFLREIVKYIEMYTINAQGYFFPDEISHKMDPEQFNYFKGLVDLVSANRHEIVGNSGRDFAEGLISGLDFSGIISGEVWESLTKIVKQIASIDFQTIMIICYIGVVIHQLLSEGMTAAVLRKLAVGGFVIFSLCKQKALGEKIRNFMENLNADEETSAQGLDEQTTIDVVVGLFGIFFLKDSDMSVKGFAKAIKGYSGFTKDAESIITNVMKLIERFGSWVAQNYFGVPSFRVFSEEIPGMEKWLEDVTDMMKENMEGKLLRNIKNAERVMTLEKKGQEFFGAARGYDKATRIRERIRPVLHSVTYLRIQFEQSGIFGKSARQMPVFLMFHGRSQIGKTKLLRPFMARLIARCEPERKDQLENDFESLVYNINPDSEYWEGYLEHVCLMIDEYSIVHPSKTQGANIQTQVIKCKNSFPYMLNMARAEAKGSNYFRGKFMVGTSNVDDMYKDAEQNVNCPLAVTNRIDFDIQVCVKKEFATDTTKNLTPEERDLDKNKIPFTPTGFCWGLHEYVLITHTFIRNEHKMTKAKPIGVEELLNLATQKYHYYRREAELDVAALKDSVKMGLNETNAQGYHNPHFELSHLIDALNSEIPLAELLLAYAKEFSYTRTGGVAPESGRVSDLFYVTAYPEVLEFLKMLPPEENGLLMCLIESVGPLGDEIAVSSQRELLPFYIAVKARVERGDYGIRTSLVDPSMHEEVFKFLVYSANIARRTLRAFSMRLFKTDFPFATLYNFVISESRWIGTVAIVIICFNLLLNVVIGIWKVIKWIFNWIFGNKESKVEKVEAKEDVKKVQFDKIPDLHVGGKVVPQAHDCSDLEAQKLGNSIVKKNYFTVHFGGQVRGQGIFVCENIFVMRSHYIDMVMARTQPGGIIRLQSVVSDERIDNTREDFFANAHKRNDLDLVVIAVPNCPRQYPNIVGKFVKDEDMKYRNKGEALFVRCLDGVPFTVPITFESYDNSTYSGKWDRKKRINLEKGFKYGMLTKDGDCGAPLLLNDVGVPGRKIFGMHTAGNEGSRFGIAGLITQEILNELIGQCKVEPQGMWDEPFKTMKIIQENVSPLPGSNARSEIMRSKLYGAWGPAKKGPSRLCNGYDSDGIYHEVLNKAIREYDEPIPEIPWDLAEVCVKSLFRDMNEGFLHKEEMRVIPLEIVIKGKVGTLYEPLPKDTSAGWPHNANPRPGYPGKTRFFGKDEVNITSTERDEEFPEEFGFDIKTDGPDWDILLREIKQMIVDILGGKRPSVVYTGCIKDELLKLKKVMEWMSRYFSGSPLAYLCVFKMFFGSFIVLMTKNKICFESCVGINPYAEDWDQLARELLHYKYQFAGDFRKFDKKQSEIILWLIGCAIRAMYHDEYDNIRKALWYELVRSRHLIGDKIIEWFHSLPSGHALTTLVNCLYVSVVMRVAWLIAHSGNITSLLTFREHVGPKDFGDDLLCGLSEYGATVFDEKPLPEMMTLIGLEMTSEDKEKEFNHRTTLWECTFLKRGFRYEKLLGRVVGPLSLETITEMPYWTKRQDSDKITLENVQNALCELALHDEATFSEWSGKILKGVASRLHYTPVMYPRWIVLDLIVGNVTPAVGGVMRKYIKNMKVDYKEETTKVRCVPVKVTISDTSDNQAGKIVDNTITGGMFGELFDTFAQSFAQGKSTTIECDYCVIVRKGKTGNDNKCHRVKIEMVGEPCGEIYAQGDNTEETSDVNKERGEGTSVFHTEESIDVVKETGLTFDNRGNSKISKVSLTEDIGKELLMSGDAGVAQETVPLFLKKPIILGQISWAAQSAGTHLAYYSLPENIFSITQVNEKVHGFLNFRGTLVMKVEVSGNIFQQGRLLCHFLPQGQVSGFYPGMRNRSLTAMTQQPRVELDLNCDSSVQMEIPYISPFPYYSVGDQTGPWGKFYVTVYSELATGSSGSTTAEVTVYAWFKDIEMVTPTYATAQGRDKSEEESKAMSGRTISGTLKTVSKVAGNLSKIPVLTAVAGPVAWATGILAGSAAAFGYSKPINEGDVMRIAPGIGQYMSNGDGIDTSQQLGTLNTNKVVILPKLGLSGLDEANLTHLCQIPAYVGSFTWTTAQANTTVLSTYGVSPSSFISVNTYDTTHKWLDLAPVTYFHYFFSYWRGSLRIRLKCVKTAAHSGKILVIYAPGGSGSPTFTQANYCLREVLDVRDKSEWEFLLPYTSNVPYQKTPSAASAVGSGSLGTLSFQVQNQLVAPATVSSTVTFLVELSGGPDFELANPVQITTECPYMDSDWVSAQGADDLPTNSCEIDVDRGFGGSVIKTGGVDIASVCIGEKITSLYQLLKRFTPCGINTSVTQPYVATTDAVINVRPFTVNFVEEGSVNVPHATNYPTNDYMTFFMPCFAYSRGGARLKVMRWGSEADPGPWLATQWFDVSDISTGASSATRIGNPLAPIVHNNFAHGQGIEVAIPQYTQGMCRLNRFSTNVHVEPGDKYTSNNRVCITTVDSGSRILYRAVADDYQLGYFIGVPALGVS